MHDACMTVPIALWGYPHSTMLVPCGGATNVPASAGQHFEWEANTGMLKLSSDMARAGWCLGVRTFAAGPLDPPQHPPQHPPLHRKGPAECHLAMMAACNELRFRLSILACNVCLVAHKTKLSQAGCDDHQNKDDDECFCGTAPIQPPTPSMRWDLKYQTMIVTSTNDGLTWPRPRKIT